METVTPAHKTMIILQSQIGTEHFIPLPNIWKSETVFSPLLTAPTNWI